MAIITFFIPSTASQPAVRIYPISSPLTKGGQMYLVAGPKRLNPLYSNSKLVGYILHNFQPITYHSDSFDLGRITEQFDFRNVKVV